MSDVVITLIQELFKNFARGGISKYPSKNVALIVQQINAVSNLLEEVPELPRDVPLFVLTVFTKCSVTNFFGPL